MLILLEATTVKRLYFSMRSFSVSVPVLWRR
jgi:hypothetical protein